MKIHSLPGVGINIGILAFILFSIGLSIYTIRPPEALPSSAPSDRFSAARAMEFVKAMAQKPHPVGTAAHREVRSYITREIESLGLIPEIQKTTSVSGKWSPLHSAAAVENIMARLEGTENGKAVMLMGHYDSVPTSPGASDDAHSIAVMLETLRALKTGPPLKNDVIFLITDAEELGLLGAKAFIEEHPWAEDVGLVLNFEARGTSGPGVMFETGPGNGWLIQEFASAAPFPLATSLSSAVYELMPNDTDLTMFIEAGYGGLNFAYFENLPHYHSWLDNVMNLDIRSLQQQGSNALSLTRHFGNIDLQGRVGTDHVYFNPLGYFFTYYPTAWVIPLVSAAAIMMCGILWLGLRKGLMSLSGIVWAVVTFVFSLGCVAVLGLLLWRLILNFRSGDAVLYASHFFFIGFLALTTSIFALLYGGLRKLGTCNLWSGALLCWLLLAFVTGFLLPGVSYLFAWPLIFGLLGLGAKVVLNEGFSYGPKTPGWLVLFAVPGLLLIPPTIDLLYEALTLALAPGLMLLTGLLLGLLIPQLAVLSRRNRWWLPTLSLCIGAVFIFAGFMNSEFDGDRRKPNSIFYLLDTDEGKSFWGSLDESPDEWTSQFFTTPPEQASLEGLLMVRKSRFIRSPAVWTDLPAPRLQVLENRRAGDQRTLRVRITSPRGAQNCMVFLISGPEITGAAVDNKKIDQPRDSSLRFGQWSYSAGSSIWSLVYAGISKEGFLLNLETDSKSPLEITLVDQSFDLPNLTDLYIRTRPSYMMPRQQLADSTLVRSSYVID